MKHIYYFIGVLFIIHEMGWLLSPKSNVARTKQWSDLLKEHKTTKWDEYPSELKELWKTKGIFSILILLWMIVGIFSFNWVAYCFFILTSIVIGLISKPFKYNIFYTIIHWLSSLWGLVFTLFVILNSYHLKIDLLDYVINIFGK